MPTTDDQEKKKKASALIEKISKKAPSKPIEKKSDKEREEQEIRIKLEIIKGVIDPNIKKELLQDLVKDAANLGISVAELKKAVEIATEEEQERLKQTRVLTAQMQYNLGIRKDQQSLYKIGNVMESISELFKDKVSEKTKQNYISKGIEFHGRILDKDGNYVKEISILDAITGGEYSSAIKPDELTASAIDSLNKFLTNSETGKSTLAAAKDFDASCKDLSREARQTVGQDGKPKIKTWKELVEKERAALGAVEATRHMAGKVIVAEKRIGIVSELQSVAEKMQGNTQEQIGAISSGIKETKQTFESVAFQMLKGLRADKEPGIDKAPALSQLEKLDRAAAEKALKAAHGEISSARSK